MSAVLPVGLYVPLLKASARSPIEHDLAGVTRFHELDGFPELGVGEAMSDNW